MNQEDNNQYIAHLESRLSPEDRQYFKIAVSNDSFKVVNSPV